METTYTLRELLSKFAESAKEVSSPNTITTPKGDAIAEMIALLTFLEKDLEKEVTVNYPN